MEKFKSLADTLGVSDQPGQPEPETRVPLEKLTGKKFSQAVLNSIEFRTYILNSLTLGVLPPQVLCRLMDHGWGKPVDYLEVKDTTNQLEDMTVEQLEERAMYLAEVARTLRRRSSEDEPTLESVH